MAYKTHRPTAGEVLDEKYGQHPEGEKFEPGSAKFMLWLTRDEFSFVFSLAFAFQLEGQLQSALDPRDFMRAVMALCVHESGYEFKGIEVDEEANLYAKQDHALELGNAIWVGMLHAGKAPDYEARMREAVEFCKDHPTLSGHLPTLLEAQQKIRSDLNTLKYMEPTADERREIRGWVESMRREIVN